MRNQKFVIFAIITLLLALTLPAGAQSSPVTVSIDRTALTTDDTLVMSISVDNSANSQPTITPPVLDGLSIVSSGTSSQTSIINGAYSSKVSYTYRIQPLTTGDLTIPPFTILLDGVEYTTNPVDISVTQGTGQSPSVGSSSAPAQSFTSDYRHVVTAEVDNETPYVGEQILYTFRYFDAGSNFSMFAQPQYQEPEFTGFWNGAEPDQRTFRVRADNGITYDVTEITVPLFPTSAGEISIDPATIFVPGTVFNPDTQLQTDPVVIDVQPLPEGAPENFNGAVGQYTMGGRIDQTSTTVGEPVTLIVSIEGNGNIEMLPEPIWEDTDEWRSFDTSSSVQSEFYNNVVSGAKTFERLVLPTTAGDIELPGVEFSYFDPEQESYRTLRTEPLSIAVAEGETEAIYDIGEPDEETDTGDVTGLADIKDAPSELALAGIPLFTQPIFWLLWLIPFGLVAGDMAINWRTNYIDRNSNQIRKSRAYKNAKRSLKKANRSENKRQSASNLLLQYISDKTLTPVSGLTLVAVANLLREHGISDTLIQQATDLLDANELNQFGTEKQIGNNDILLSTQEVIANLEKEFEE